MLLEYVSFPRLRSRLRLVLHFQLADLRELCPAGKARLLQRRDIPSDRCRTSTISKTIASLLIISQRILWFRAATRLGRAEEAPAYMVQSCTSYIQLRGSPHKRLTHSPQRRRDPSRATVHGCRNPRNGQLRAQHQWFVSFPFVPPTPSSPHLNALTLCTRFWLSRFTVLYDSGSDAIFG